MRATARQTGSARTTDAVREALAAGPVGRRSTMLFIGPAVVASIAYMDPGNFATNIEAGAGYGYRLLWVVLLANLVAMLFQAMSAKLGIVTGRNLAQVCGERLPPVPRYLLWAGSEVAAMATDLAEFLGGAIGLALLADIPLLAGMVVTALATYGVLWFERLGYRRMEIIIGAFVATIGASYLIELVIAPVAWGPAARGLVTPSMPDAHALTIAVGIIGATVMPHAVFLHSDLARHRADGLDPGARRRLLRFSNREVVAALALAGLVNMAMVVMAAAAFHPGHAGVASIETAYATLDPLLGRAAAAAFLVALIASGLSSSVVGTMAGQMIMAGFLGFRVPLWLRRLVTMVPAFVVVALGVDTTRALVLSQVVLSFTLPIPMIALLVFTRSRAVMGDFANSNVAHYAALAGAALVLMLNCVLLAQVLGIA